MLWFHDNLAGRYAYLPSVVRVLGATQNLSYRMCESGGSAGVLVAMALHYAFDWLFARNSRRNMLASERKMFDRTFRLMLFANEEKATLQ